MKALVTRHLLRTAQLIRDAWLIVGVTAVLIVTLESAYRAQRVVRRALAGDDAEARRHTPANPFDTTRWATEYSRDHLREEEVRWAPYVYVRNPTFTGRHITVDSLGHRVTPLPAVTGTSVVRLFFLGGSTTFGWYQRDAFTIPAEAARRLQQLVGNQTRIEAINLGAPGHTFTQEILELMLQLRVGNRPDVVVFYDGINDVMATVQNGRAGIPQNESNRVADFNRGRTLAAQSAPGLANDVRVLRRAATSAGGRLEFVKRLVAAKGSAPATRESTDSLAQHIAQVFAANARLVEALAANYGFQTIYVWQPALLSTRKTLTERERWLRQPGRIGDVHRALPPLIGPAMAAAAGSRFIDATGLFDHDSLEVFADLYGHTYERANPRVVDTLMAVLRPAVLQAARVRVRTSGR